MTPGGTGLAIFYLIASVGFIIGLKMLSSPKTAVAGNFIGALGMLIAIVVTLLIRGILNLELIVGGILLGSVIGTVMAKRVEMTAMPQMVALLNGFGGLASVLVVAGELFIQQHAQPSPMTTIPIVLGAIIGAVTFTGSVVAWAKLEERMTTAPVTYPLQNFGNLLLALVALGLSVIIVTDPAATWALIALAVVALVLGVTLTIPIGGADMPVVIALLNSYSGLAAAAAGFVLNNSVLIVCGSLVGASGIILTVIMCNAMNRSIANVLFGAFGAAPAEGGPQGPEGTGAIKSYLPEDAAAVLENARSVIIIPGYGMAVAQAQHAVRELADVLEERGATVLFAIHPVAGRMPGHMNVLLAEANVPYEKMLDLEEVNPHFPEADVALVIGANDITNPAARTNKQSPIYGMPILDVDKARTIMVCKRSMRPGFAGIDNELYLNPKTLMLFGDAKKFVMDLVAALKS